MYQKSIKQIIDQIGRPEVDPRHVEGYMRIQHSTLDALSAKKFRSEVIVCVGCVDIDGIENAEKIAILFGL
jgi:hypothetical protein